MGVKFWNLGDDPRDVKARLKVWAQAVAIASASPRQGNWLLVKLLLPIFRFWMKKVAYWFFFPRKSFSSLFLEAFFLFFSECSVSFLVMQYFWYVNHITVNIARLRMENTIDYWYDCWVLVYLPLYLLCSIFATWLFWVLFALELDWIGLCKIPCVQKNVCEFIQWFTWWCCWPKVDANLKGDGLDTYTAKRKILEAIPGSAWVEKSGLVFQEYS